MSLSGESLAKRRFGSPKADDAAAGAAAKREALQASAQRKLASAGSRVSGARSTGLSTSLATKAGVAAKKTGVFDKLAGRLPAAAAGAIKK